MTKAARSPPPGSSFELYARAMLDHWLGKKVTVEFERDDGYRSGSKIDSYFTPPSKWPRMEREAIRLVGGRVADPGGARSDPRPGERVSGQCAAVAAGAGDLQLRPHAGQQPRPRGRHAPLSTVLARASRHHPKGRAPDRKQPDSWHLVGGPPALREVERAPRSAGRTPHAPGSVQGANRRLVRSPPHPSGGTRAPRPRDGLGSGARDLGGRIPTRGLRRRPRATLSRRPGKVHPSQRASQRSAWPSSTNSGSRPSRKPGRTKGSSGRRRTSPRCPRSSTGRTGTVTIPRRRCPDSA